MIKAVFFDMGGTIETFWQTRELCLEATPGLEVILKSAGIFLDLTTEQLFEIVKAGLKRYHEWCVESLEEYPSGRVWQEFIFGDFPEFASRLETISEELAFYAETKYYSRAMRPEIPEVLEAIHQMGLKIGVISNVNSRGQVPFNLKKYEIDTYFSTIVLSSEFGRRKPDPAIFHYAARLANSPTSECLYVGDRVARDILGARKAGFGMAIQIRHHYNHGEEDLGAVPDAVIENMKELIEIIQANNNNSALRKTPNPIRAILFDAGDILYYRPERGRLLNQFLMELGLQITVEAQAEQEELSRRAIRGELPLQEYREAVVKTFGIKDPEQICRGILVLEAEDNNVRFFEGVQGTLQSLKERGYMLGIVTDTANTIYTKLRWFENGGFGHVWDSIISSREFGVRKPDPILFQAALHQLGMTADQAVFIGHKTSELDGARAVGLKTIAFNYDPDARADFYVQHFADILDVPIFHFMGEEQPH